MDELEEASAVSGLVATNSGARGLVRSGVGYGAALVVANALTAVFQFGVARLLEPSAYSLLVALLALIVVVGVPLAAIQAAVARGVAAELAAGSPARAGVVVEESAEAVLRLAPIVVAVAVAVGVPLAIWVNVQDFLPLVGTAITLACSFALPVVWGAVQGMSRFRFLGGVQVGYAVLKLALGLLLAAAGAGVGGVMLGIAAASVAAVVATTFAVRPLLAAAAGRARHRRRLFTRYNTAAALAFAAFASVTSIDVIVARLSLPHDVAGAYSAASVAARALLLVAAPVTTVLFPRVAALGDLRRERRHLLGGVAAVALVATPVVLVFWLLPDLVLAVTFGHAYDAARPWLGPLGLAMTLYAIVSVYQFHFLSLGRTTYVRVAIPIAITQIALFAAFHDSANQLIAVQIVTAVLFVAASETYERLLLHRSTAAV